MKRTRLKKESAKHRAYREELAGAAVDVFVRSRGICERCRNAKVVVIHHKLRRSQGGTNALSNLAGLCTDCHTHIHNNPAESYRQGWLTSVGKYVEVTHEPMQEVHDG